MKNQQEISLKVLKFAMIECPFPTPRGDTEGHFSTFKY